MFDWYFDVRIKNINKKGTLNNNDDMAKDDNEDRNLCDYI